MTENAEAKPPITLLDAGPCITFCAVNRESMLHDVLTLQHKLAVPDVVNDEILRKKGQGFAAVSTSWTRLTSSDRVEILPGTIDDPDLRREVERIGKMPFTERLKQSKDLGEIFAIAHACVRQKRGEPVVLLIDDGEGTRLAHINRIRTISSITVLNGAIRMGLFENRGDLKTLYSRMRPLDQSLLPIENTALLDKKIWTIAKEAREAKAEAS